MKRINNFRNKITLIIALCLASFSTYAQDNDLSKLEYKAYLIGSKSLWKKAVDERKAIFENTRLASDLFDLVKAQHGLLSATMIDQDEDLFGEHVGETKDNIDKLIEEDYEVAEAKALLSSVYGFEMAYSSWKGMFLGPKSSSAIESALKLNNESPLVWMVQANSKLFTPAMFGGDKKEAVEAFEKSVLLFEEQGSTSNNWRYLDALAWLGQAYSKIDEYDKARAVYNKALEIEPEFNWVKKALLPAIAQK